jgi:cytochrome b
LEAGQPEPVAPDTHPTPSHQKVWDVPTRLVHWSLVILIALSWWSVENKRMDIHYWSGLCVVGLIVFRIYWGFAGPETARFTRFIKGPRAVFGYMGKLFRPDYHASFGHNPLGALSVIALLLAVGTQVGLGLFASDTSYVSSGPLSNLVDYETSEEITELHEDFFNVLLAVIGLHLAAIVFYLVGKQINLIGPMITGRRKAVNVEGPPAGIAPISLLRLVIGIGLAVGVVWFIAR